MHQLLPLANFSRQRLCELLGARAARLYGFGLALSFAFMIMLVPRPASLPVLEQLLVRALTSASWIVAGLSALSAARDLERRDREEGATALVMQRGHAPSTLELSRVLGAATLIAFWVGVPALGLVVLAWIKLGDPGAFRWALGWLAFVAAYAAALGLVLGALARGAARLSPARGRTVLALFVFLPELLRLVWPVVPSVPRAFAWALERAGGAIS